MPFMHHVSHHSTSHHIASHHITSHQHTLIEKLKQRELDDLCTLLSCACPMVFTRCGDIHDTHIYFVEGGDGDGVQDGGDEADVRQDGEFDTLKHTYGDMTLRSHHAYDATHVHVIIS